MLKQIKEGLKDILSDDLLKEKVRILEEKNSNLRISVEYLSSDVVEREKEIGNLESKLYSQRADIYRLSEDVKYWKEKEILRTRQWLSLDEKTYTANLIIENEELKASIDSLSSQLEELHKNYSAVKRRVGSVNDVIKVTQENNMLKDKVRKLQEKIDGIY